MDRYEYTDAYGDILHVHLEHVDGSGRTVRSPEGTDVGLYIETGPDGVLIPLDGIDEYLTAMQALADTARRLAGGGE